DGRLRSRSWHLVSAVCEQERSRRYHEQRRAGLGRQRNLAGAGRRRPDGRVSTGLCGADAGAVHAHDRDARRPDLSRCCVRISLAHHAKRAKPLGPCLCRRIGACSAGAGHCAWRHPAGHPCRGPTLWRRMVGLVDAVQHPHRTLPSRRLCAARRNVAGDEDGGRGSRQGLSPELGPGVRDAGRAPRGGGAGVFARVAGRGGLPFATPFLSLQYAQRWFTWPNVILTAPVPIAVAAVTVMLLRSLANRQDYRPFFLSLALFALSYGGLGISMYPYIVPQSITIWQAASPQNSLIFMLFGVALLVPLILGYSAWAYWVFRGKVRPESGYH